MRHLLPLAAGLLLSTLLFACFKDDLNDPKFADHDAQFAFPLFSTDISLKDLMTKVLNDTLSGDTLLVNSDGTMTLIYTGDVAEKPATDIFRFLFSPSTIPFTDTSVTYPIEAPDGVVVREALLKNGTFNLVGNNASGTPYNVTIEIPQMVKDGKPFQLSGTIPPGSVIWKDQKVPVAGYRLKTGSNLLTLRYYAYDSQGKRIKLPDYPIINFPAVNMSYEGLEFSYLEGYWGYSAYPLTRDTIEIDINKTDLEGGVKIKDPKVTMIISNSWGFPTRGVVKYLSFIGKDGEELPLKSNVFNNDSIDFNWPDITKGEVGQTKYTYVTLDSDNSNIADIFNIQPTQLIYEVEGVSNAQKDPSIVGFLTDSSTIRLGVRVELLLEGAAKNFAADQTLDLNFGDYANLDSSDIQDVEFKLVSENTTPISAALQVYFQDEANRTLDSLFVGGQTAIIQSAPINSAGVSTGTQRTETFIPMSIQRFNVVRRAKQAVLQSSFTTANGGDVPVRLLADNQVLIKMGLKVRTKF